MRRSSHVLRVAFLGLFFLLSRGCFVSSVSSDSVSGGRPLHTVRDLKLHLNEPQIKMSGCQSSFGNETRPADSPDGGTSDELPTEILHPVATPSTDY